NGSLTRPSTSPTLTIPFTALSTSQSSSLSLHDALPISEEPYRKGVALPVAAVELGGVRAILIAPLVKDNTVSGLFSIFRKEVRRSEEHTSELQSQSNLVCRLLLEKKNITLPPREPAARL